jgi:hypothetical protein
MFQLGWRRLRRQAAFGPAATPPTMTIFLLMSVLLCENCYDCLNILVTGSIMIPGLKKKLRSVSTHQRTSSLNSDSSDEQNSFAVEQHFFGSHQKSSSVEQDFFLV